MNEKYWNTFSLCWQKKTTTTTLLSRFLRIKWNALEWFHAFDPLFTMKRTLNGFTSYVNVREITVNPYWASRKKTKIRRQCTTYANVREYLLSVQHNLWVWFHTSLVLFMDQIRKYLWKLRFRIQIPITCISMEKKTNLIHLWKFLIKSSVCINKSKSRTIITNLKYEKKC